MKKYLKIASMLLLTLLILPLQVRADVIYEPWDDSFYDEHREDCEYHSRSYTADGPNGEVTVYESPESSWKKSDFENGSEIWISYLYTDAEGIRWGHCDDWESNVSGWVPMDYLELIYDGISFEEDYGDQFVQQSGALGEEYQGKIIYFWTYPGCEDSNRIDLFDDEPYMPEYDVVYTDDDGRSWGRLNYYMGIRNAWICLDDPTADFDTLYPQGIETIPPETERTEIVPEIVPKSNDSAKLLVSAAVVAVVAVTAGLLVLLKKKKG